MTTRITLKRFGWWSSASVLLIMLTHTAGAVPLQLQCPAQYPNRQQWSDLHAASWQKILAGDERGSLGEAGLMLGPPTDNAVLRGVDLPQSEGRTFHFSGTEQDLDKWIYCDYGTGKFSRLAYQLPVHIKRCESKEKMVRGRGRGAYFRCD